MKIDKKIISESIAYYGIDIQSTVCMEECAELIQAISKEKRGKGDRNHLAEEIADVLICIGMLMQIYGINDVDIDGWINYKQERMAKRIRSNE